MDLQGKLIEGKTKIIYNYAPVDDLVVMYFKDDITAGDGVKHDKLEGKAYLDWNTNKNIFEFLNRCGINTHYVSSPEPQYTVVKALQRKINLEVVSRRIATGSIVKSGLYEEGKLFDPIITQFYYKDDYLHDPMLDNDFIYYLIKNKNFNDFDTMKEINQKVFFYLEKIFRALGCQLIDFKLEYGIVDGKVTLIDEITAGSFRLWPFRDWYYDSNNDLYSQLDPSGRLDKDVYRMGGGLKEVYNKFKIISDMTDQFEFMA